MAGSGPQDTFTLNAAADLSAKRYHAVRLSAAGLTNQASDGTNSALVGVLQNKPQSGESATIAYKGISKVVYGGTVTAGDVISHDGSGRMITVTSALMALGRALETGAAGQTGTALLFPPVRWTGAP